MKETLWASFLPLHSFLSHLLPIICPQKTTEEHTHRERSTYTKKNIFFWGREKCRRHRHIVVVMVVVDLLSFPRHLICYKMWLAVFSYKNTSAFALLLELTLKKYHQHQPPFNIIIFHVHPNLHPLPFSCTTTSGCYISFFFVVLWRKNISFWICDMWWWRWCVVFGVPIFFSFFHLHSQSIMSSCPHSIKIRRY